MWPVIFSLGAFQLRTLSLLAVIAFIGTAFVFWRKGKDEHYDETLLFDGFLLSSLVGLLVGRIVFVVLSLSQFSGQLWSIFDVVNHPGFNMLGFLLGAGGYLFRFSRKKKWDEYEILDFWVLAITLGSMFVWLGMLFDGTGFGLPTSLPIGVTFPGVFEAHHPVQFYLALMHLLLFWYLSWADFHYRTFSWYRGGKNTAQTGFLTSVFILASGVMMLAMNWLRPSQIMIGGMALDLPLALVFIVGGLVMLFIRSGRSLGGGRSKPVTNLEDFRV